MSTIALTDRSLVRLSGKDAEELLQRLITTNLDKVAMNQAGYGALLTPQGKIITDFIVIRREDGFYFDLPASEAEGFAKKMKLYRMRQDVPVDSLPWTISVTPNEDGDVTDGEGFSITDPRNEALGKRHYVPNEAGQASTELTAEDQAALNALYIPLAIPQGHIDFAYGDAFPHDVNMDDLEAVDFQKGCYVGQEVVSRMQHRGTARRRIVQLQAKQALATGSELMVDGKQVGTIGAVCQHDAGYMALAFVRLDKVSDALVSQTPILAGETDVTVQLPDYATFGANFDAFKLQ